jgi:thymidylate synthase (FAD)
MVPVIKEIEPNPEALIAYCARITSDNQTNPEFQKLFEYMLAEEPKHWSPFQMSNLLIGFRVSRDISQQIIRHWSMNTSSEDEEMDWACWHGIQEFSQRYNSPVLEFMDYKPRKQGTKNRQVGDIEMSQKETSKYLDTVQTLREYVKVIFQSMLYDKTAREIARASLPAEVMTTIYVNGTARSWLHYVANRMDVHAQWEHRCVASAVYDILKAEYPTFMKIAKPQGYVPLEAR